MGDLATPEDLASTELVSRWEALQHDPSLRDLPYKIELNGWGKVEMSPASNRHARLQAELGFELRRQLGGVVLTECSVLTRIGIRVPDVAWASPEFLSAYGEITPYLRAPEICVEIVSPSNPRGEFEAKTSAYLQAGAQEVWIAWEDGTLRYFDSAGEKSRTGFAIVLVLPPPAQRKP